MVTIKGGGELLLMYHTLSRVKSGGGAASLLAVGGLLACKDMSPFEAFSCLWPPSSTVYKLLQIERMSLCIHRVSA